MPHTHTVTVPLTHTGQDTALEDMCQVVIHNDDYNTMDHVVLALVQIFGHPTALAVKIMLEAHEKGSAIAEIEPETQALRHRDQLRSKGLIATVEKAV